MTREIIPARKLQARVDGVFRAAGRDFVSAPVESLVVGFDGIEGDFHAGLTRKSGGREPWYPRGTEMKNERQLTIVSRDELALVAKDMGLETVEPGWIGANLTLAGIADLTMLPPATLLFFENGVTLKVDQLNKPCRLAGGSIAAHVGREGDQELALSFKDAAKYRRGLTVWVEKPGTISMGEAVTVRIPEHWAYRA